LSDEGRLSPLMPCYYPIKGYRSRQINPSGKYPIVFNVNDGWIDKPIRVPCGQCIGCRLERSRQWAVRCVHESTLYENNCFITLTFNEENVPKDGSLIKNSADFQKFMKRLRKYTNQKIRFFHCGEYGEKLSRPHHHACLFNYDFPDKKLYTVRNGIRIYTSEILLKLWPYGYHTIGDVTFESAAYIARYVTKKITGSRAEEHYQGRVPEYVTMSRKPGIGKGWLDKFSDDIYPHDYLIVNGNKCKPPKYYDSIYHLTNEKESRRIKAIRAKHAVQNPENTIARLEVREKVKKSRLTNLKRSYENAT